MRKKGWFVFFCLLLLSFELVRPSEMVWFGVYSDTESLTDLQRSALEKTILQNIEDRGEVTLLHSTESVEMPADLIDVKRKFYEFLRNRESRYGVFAWPETDGKKSVLRIFILDAEKESEAEGRGDYRSRYDIFAAVLPAVEDLVSKWKTPAEEPKETVEYVERNWIKITGGFFKMGEDYHKADNRPQHEVQISDFWMDPYEVTVVEFREFVEDTGYYIAQGAFIHNEQMQMGFERALNFENPGYAVSDRQPVSCVSWIDALHYCNWKSLQRGLTPCYEFDGKGVRWNRSADGYRLPTEAEWEYAASGGKPQRSRIFAGSDNIASVAVHAANSNGAPAVVGSLAPNELGLYDMSGNVFEWCWDIYGENYYGESSWALDPAGPAEGAYRVYRGGSWFSPPMICLTFNRLSNNPQLRSNLVGFRLARSGPDYGFDVSR